MMVPAQPDVVNIGIDASFHQMELPNTRHLQLHNIMPPHLQGVVPTMFHNARESARVRYVKLKHMLNN
ncbi:hypothetical protein R6Q57_010324 [Mikania cordata]